MNKTIDFKKYSSINIGPKVEVKIINEIGSYKGYTILGKGHNLLISPKPPKFAILGDEFSYIIPKNDKLVVGAATTSGKLLTYARKNNLAHFELLAKLPGTLGGIVKMNGGLKEWEIFNHLHCITTDKGTFLKEQIPHSYRDTKIDGIIYEVVFNVEKGYDKELQKMFNRMRDNQPNLPSAGSCFKNPKENSAGYLIEKVGLKGHTIGGMAFSSMHANFLVNMGGGTFDEAIKLITLAKTQVKEKFDIELEEEIKIM